MRTGHNVQLGYLSQHAEELGSSGTVGEREQRATRLTPNKARALLGRFLFSGEEAEKPMDGLSGGERRRLSLAYCRGHEDRQREAPSLAAREAVHRLSASSPLNRKRPSRARALFGVRPVARCAASSTVPAEPSSSACCER